MVAEEQVSSGWMEIVSGPELEQVRDSVESLGERFLGAFQKRIGDGVLTVLIAHSPQAGWHLSISHASELVAPSGDPLLTRLPTWEEIKEARYVFTPPDKYMAIIIPPKPEYVNVHPTVMHLYEV